MSKVTILLPDYNELNFVDQCLSNLQKIKESTYPELQVICKNQGSTDGSFEKIKAEYPWVKAIEGDNCGLSKAFNIMRKEADTEYILCLGMDAFPNPDVIPGLIDYFDKNPDVGAGTVKLLLNDGSIDMDCHRAFPTPVNSIMRLTGLSKLFPKSSFFNGYFLAGEDLDKPHEIDLCISHFFFTRRELIESIGGFDEDYFLFGEDVDICYRVKQSGAKIMYLPQWQSLHVKGGSLGTRKTARNIAKKPLEVRLRVQRLSASAMETFVRKHYMKKYPLILNYIMIYSARVLGKIRVYMETRRT